MTVTDSTALRGGTSLAPADDAGLVTMTLVEHLTELRRRAIISITAVALATVIAFFFYNQVLHFMAEPYRSSLRRHHLGFFGGRLVVSGPLEGFATRLKVSGYLGLAAALPVVLWELWRFVTPGLHRRERRYAVPFIAASLVLFAAGCAMAVAVWPKALDFLIGVGGHNVVPLYSPARYVSLYALACLAFGVTFQFPVLLVALELTGVVPSRKLRRWRRPAIVVIALVAAVATPSNDPFSFLAMAVPLYFFYEVSILIARLLKK
jgi:sec-independent protein translocase protein TatC